MKRLQRFKPFPIHAKFTLMEPSPFTNKAPRPGRTNFSSEQFPRKIEGSHLTLVLIVEMGRVVIVEKHPND